MAFNKTTSIGLDSVLIGAIAAGGAMSTTLNEVGTTVIGSPAFTKAAPTITTIATEESDAAEFQITTGGEYTVSWSTYNVDPSLMVQLFGGTVTGGLWSPPANSPTIEVSVQMTSKTGLQISMPRVALAADLAINFQKETPAQVNITGTVLPPTNGAALFTYGEVVPAG